MAGPSNNRKSVLITGLVTSHWLQVELSTQMSSSRSGNIILDARLVELEIHLLENSTEMGFGSLRRRGVQIKSPISRN